MFSCKAPLHSRSCQPYFAEPGKKKCRCKRHADFFQGVKHDINRCTRSAPATPKRNCRCDPPERYEIKPVQICLPSPSPPPEVARYSLAKWYNKKPFLQVSPKEQIKRLEKYCEIKNLVYAYKKEHERQMEIENFHRFREDPSHYRIEDDDFLQDYVFNNALDEFSCGCMDSQNLSNQCHCGSCQNEEAAVSSGIQKIVISDRSKHCSDDFCPAVHQTDFNVPFIIKRDISCQSIPRVGIRQLQLIEKRTFPDEDRVSDKFVQYQVKTLKRNRGTNTCDTVPQKIKVDVNLNCLSH